MDAARKEAIRKFKEQKIPRGAFAVRCKATGHVWVGSTRNLNATKNGFWFALRIGSHSNKSLQTEWKIYGEASFDYEILEKLEDDVVPLGIPDLLKEKRLFWIDKLRARPL
jgi:hypothetical protein